MVQTRAMKQKMKEQPAHAVVTSVVQPSHPITLNISQKEEPTKSPVSQKEDDPHDDLYTEMFTIDPNTPYVNVTDHDAHSLIQSDLFNINLIKDPKKKATQTHNILKKLIYKSSDQPVFNYPRFLKTVINKVIEFSTTHCEFREFLLPVFEIVHRYCHSQPVKKTLEECLPTFNLRRMHQLCICRSKKQDELYRSVYEGLYKDAKIDLIKFNNLLTGMLTVVTHA